MFWGVLGVVKVCYSIVPRGSPPPPCAALKGLQNLSFFVRDKKDTGNWFGPKRVFSSSEKIMHDALTVFRRAVSTVHS